MKTIRKWLKTIALFFTALILFQSCATYKTPVTLEQAVQEEKAVKIITVDDDTSKYKYIVYEEGQFYGVKNNPGEDVKFPINSEEVTDVLMKKGLPWWVWTLIVIGGLTLIVIVIALVSGPGGGYNWYRS